MNQPYKLTGILRNKREMAPTKDGGKPSQAFDLEAKFQIKDSTEVRNLPFRVWGFSGQDIARYGEGSEIELTLLPKEYNGFLRFDVQRVTLVKAGHDENSASNGLDFDSKPLAELAAASVANDDSFVF
jgi:hypothetical protein